MNSTIKSVICRLLLTALSLMPSSGITFAQRDTALEKGSGAAQTGRLALAPCEIAGITGKGRCGNYEVYENRARRTGRKIILKIVVLPATGAKRAPDPLVYLSGGPG